MTDTIPTAEDLGLSPEDVAENDQRVAEEAARAGYTPEEMQTLMAQVNVETGDPE